MLKINMTINILNTTKWYLSKYSSYSQTYAVVHCCLWPLRTLSINSPEYFHVFVVECLELLQLLFLFVLLCIPEAIVSFHFLTLLHYLSSRASSNFFCKEPWLPRLDAGLFNTTRALKKGVSKTKTLKKLWNEDPLVF